MAFGFARAIGRTLASGYYKAGYGVSAVYEAIKRRGYGYTEHTMRQDISRIYARMEREGPIRRWPRDVTPRREIIFETEIKKPERTYRIRAEIDIYDWEERQWKKKNVTMYDNYLRTKEGWANKFVSDWSDVYITIYKQTIERVNIFSIEHSKGHLY